MAKINSSYRAGLVLSLAFLGALLGSLQVSAAPDRKPSAPAPLEVMARPKIVGEIVPDAQLKTLADKVITLDEVIKDKFTLLVFSKPENIWFEAALGYFGKVGPYLVKLGYQVVIVTPESYDYIQDLAKVTKNGQILIDNERKAFLAMGLMDRAAADAPSINAAFLVAPNKKILFQFSSVSDAIPFSGEVLVLAARVYKDVVRTSPEVFGAK